MKVVLIILLIIALMVCFGVLSYNEAVKQGRNKVLWCVLGCIFLLNSFIALKVSKHAKDTKHDVKWWSFLGIVFGVVAVCSLETGLIAEDKRHDFTAWVLMSLLFVPSLLVLLLSFLLKPFEHDNSVSGTETETQNTEKQQLVSDKSGVWTCEKCGKENASSSYFCIGCGEMKKQ